MKIENALALHNYNFSWKTQFSNKTIFTSQHYCFFQQNDSLGKRIFNEKKMKIVQHQCALLSLKVFQSIGGSDFPLRFLIEWFFVCLRVNWIWNAFLLIFRCVGQSEAFLGFFVLGFFRCFWGSGLVEEKERKAFCLRPIVPLSLANPRWVPRVPKSPASPKESLEVQ